MHCLLNNVNNVKFKSFKNKRYFGDGPFRKYATTLVNWSIVYYVNQFTR